jgi:hypothetical protein
MLASKVKATTNGKKCKNVIKIEIVCLDLNGADCVGVGSGGGEREEGEEE